MFLLACVQLAKKASFASRFDMILTSGSMHVGLFDNGYLNVLYGTRCFVGWKSRDDPGGNCGCNSGVTART